MHQWQWKKEALTLSFCDCLILFLSSIHHTIGSSCSFSLHSFLFIYSLDWSMAIVLLLTLRGRNITGHSPKADECEVIIRLTFRCLLKVEEWLVSRHRTNLTNLFHGPYLALEISFLFSSLKVLKAMECNELGLLSTISLLNQLSSLMDLDKTLTLAMLQTFKNGLHHYAHSPIWIPKVVIFHILCFKISLLYVL